MLLFPQYFHFSVSFHATVSSLLGTHKFLHPFLFSFLCMSDLLLGGYGFRLIVYYS